MDHERNITHRKVNEDECDDMKESMISKQFAEDIKHMEEEEANDNDFKGFLHFIKEKNEVLNQNDFHFIDTSSNSNAHGTNGYANIRSNIKRMHDSKNEMLLNDPNPSSPFINNNEDGYDIDESGHADTEKQRRVYEILSDHEGKLLENSKDMRTYQSKLSLIHI